jgi:uncharacterized repeat protein (TIGR03803 family)
MIRTRNVSRKAALGCGLALILFAPFTAEASATETVLYSFTGSTGQDPLAGLAVSGGSDYGTTESGGAHNYGAVFKLDSTGTETVLLSFDYSHGARPNAGLISDKAGNLYGTTQQGGANSDGVVFKIAPDGTETVLHTFTGFSSGDGAYPVAGLIRDSKGHLYGTTQHGGPSDNGTVFKLAKSGSETVLYSFSGASDGAWPYGGLIEDSAGNFFGTTIEGGTSNDGIVFKLSRNGSETVLHNFGGSDGMYPVAGLIMDGPGNLYGTTKQGGAHGSGTVFKVAPDGTETVLHSFAGASDGAFPMCNLIMDKKGNLYGTANGGGAHGAGTVFKVSAKGADTTLYSFAGGSDGAFPQAPVIRDPAGNLYGTTSSGGAGSDGTVFMVAP